MECIARADRVDSALGEPSDNDVGIERLVLGAAASQHAALAQLQDERLAARGVIQCRGKRPHPGARVAEGKSRFALVGGDQVEIFEFGDVSPAARYLAVGNLEPPFRNGRYQLGDRPAIEYSVAKVAEHDRIALFGSNRRGETLEDLV